MSDDTPSDESLSRPPRKPKAQTWDNWIEEIIRDAQARGEFDNLSGKGKPLPARRNPFLASDSSAAYDLIQNSGHTLPWIEDAREIDQRIEQARQRLTQHHAWYQAQVQARPAAEHPALETAWARHRVAFEQEVVEINRLIDIYNLKAPLPRLHRLRLALAAEYERLRA